MFISDTLISCKTVPMELGRVSLEVSLNGVDFVGDGLFYETINLPQMSNMHLRIGTLNDSTTVIVNTTALPQTDRLACHFGDKIVQVRVSKSSSKSPSKSLT
jgi:hypothetical protein